MSRGPVPGRVARRGAPRAAVDLAEVLPGRLDGGRAGQVEAEVLPVREGRLAPPAGPHLVDLVVPGRGPGGLVDAVVRHGCSLSSGRRPVWDGPPTSGRASEVGVANRCG